MEDYPSEVRLEHKVFYLLMMGWPTDEICNLLEISLDQLEQIVRDLVLQGYISLHTVH